MDEREEDEEEGFWVGRMKMDERKEEKEEGQEGENS